MRILRASGYRRMPWKNGGGETTEIAVFPEAAGLGDFLWRISMARVESDGPFSAFPGIDRTLTILEGEALRLAISGRPPVELRGGDAPFTFPADRPTDSTLLGGPVTDLNVMTRRGEVTHTVRRLDVGGKITIGADADVSILFCHRGPATVTAEGGSEELQPLDCAIVEEKGTPVEVNAESSASLFLIELRQQGAG